MLFHCSLARNQCSQYLQFAMETFCHLFGSIYLYHRPIFSLRSHIFFLNPPEHVCSNKSQPLLILCYHDVGSQFTPFWHVYAIIRNTFQVFFSCYWSLYLISSNRLHEYAAIRAVLNSYKCIGQLQSWLMQLWRWHPAWRINQKTILAGLLLFML